MPGSVSVTSIRKSLPPHFRTDGDGPRPGRVLDGVVQEIDQGQAHRGLVDPDNRRSFQSQGQSLFLFFRQGPHVLGRPLNEANQIRLYQAEGDMTAVRPGQRQQVFDEAGQPALFEGRGDFFLVFDDQQFQADDLATSQMLPLARGFHH